ncbi:MAG TPA: ATP-binding cassette domain-containing protein, partial [Solirubrobacteraceae bacterium]|nr:ATP-binding cassette domain-containing protein [Solirubrobacteraceae bacterium]
MGVPAIVLDAAAVRIGRRTIWSDVSMRVEVGEFVALLGANGSGKSTLLRALLGALPASAGRIEVLGRAPGAASGEIGYLPQRRSFAPQTRLRGVDVVRLGFDGDRWGVPLPLSWGRGAARARETRRRVA